MKMKRFISIAFSVALLVALLCSPAYAASTDWFYSPAMRTGVEWSGLSTNDVCEMALNKTSILAKDIDVEFSHTTVGLSEYFVWSNSRTANITVKDEDPGDNENEELFKLTARFGVVNGLYRPTSYGTRTILDDGEVEDNNIIELYLLVTILPIANDGANSVESNLLKYRFKTTY